MPWFTSLRAVCIALLVLLVSACGDPTKADLVEKARGIDTRTALEQKLGKPDNISKLGPVEKWTYNAKDGEVTFVITGNTVALQMTGQK